MDASTTTSCWQDKKYNAGNMLFEVAPWEPAFEKLVTAMRAEFLRAADAIHQLRLENHVLRGKIASCTGTAAQHANPIKTHIGPSKKFTDVVSGHLLSDEGPPTISVARGSPTSFTKRDMLAKRYGSDWQVPITEPKHEPEPVCGSEDSTVDAPTHTPPTIPSSSGVRLAAASRADADEGTFEVIHDVDTPREAPRISIKSNTRSSSFLAQTFSTESKPSAVSDRGVSSKPSSGSKSSAGSACSKHSSGSKDSALTVRDLWEKKPKPKLLRRSPSSRELSVNTDLSPTFTGTKSGDELKGKSVFQPLMLHPWRPGLWVWDTYVAVVTAYDVIMVPLQVFSVIHVATHALDLMTACVWTLDILVCFLRGKDIGGVLDMRPSTIAKSYLKTWFVMDVALVAMDWVFIIASSAELNVVRSMRLRRAFRFLRVLRVLRVKKILLSVRRRHSWMPQSDYTEALTNVIKFLLAMWLVNHYVACGWYAIADIDTEPNWIASTFDESDSIQYRYSTALHWSLTQFTPASMEVVPTNVVERAYNVGAIFFGLVMFTSFVSHMTTAVARFQQLTAHTDLQRRNLRNYVQCRQVSFDLGKQIEAYVRVANKRIKCMRLLESDVTVLRMLPENLLRKLREEVHTPVLCVHPFFEKLQSTEGSAFISICNLAAAENNVLIGEELFRCGQTATDMYFSTAGDLSYYFEDVHGYTVEEVPEGSWFSEATLWCNWTHTGRMMSSDDLAEIVTVKATELHRIISTTVSFSQAQRYAKMYCLLAVDECGSKSLITDIWAGTNWVAMIVRYAWAPFLHNSLKHSSQERYVNAFHAWKIHTTEAVDARLQSQERHPARS